MSEINSHVSSANRVVKKSFIDKRKRRGPNTDP